MQNSAKVSAFVDDTGEVKIVGQNGLTHQPAAMAALCQYPELYRTQGVLYYVKNGASFWEKLILLLSR